MYLLDTNACIEYLNGRSHHFLQRLLTKMPEEIAVCSVVKAELHYGAERSRNPQEAFVRIEEFLAPYRSLPFDDECARVYGQIRARLARAGLPIGPNDLLIAATAVAFGKTLVTHNTREFSRVEGLTCEDWKCDFCLD
jgi:tRNA(fMet)-specific endonuclease VapC